MNKKNRLLCLQMIDLKMNLFDIRENRNHYYYPILFAHN